MTTYRAWNLKPLDRSALKELTAAIAQQSTEELENRAMETMDGEPWSEEKYQMTLAAQQKETALLAGILAARGITDPADALTLLAGEEELSDPALLTDMEKACQRIWQAIDNGETIVVFGDYDVDGVTATALLYQHLKGMGANVKCMLPSREGDGYGLSKNAIQSMHNKGCTLIVTVDNGISAVEEADFAASLGMDLIITDHHLPPETLPKAVAVVDPRREDDHSPFKGLCGAGVAFKLCAALDGCPPEEMLDYCGDLAAVGTVADVMPLVGENRTLVKAGLRQLQQTDRPGFGALLEEVGLAGKPITAENISYAIAPRINAAGRMDNAVTALQLVLCEDPDRAEELAHKLNMDPIALRLKNTVQEGDVMPAYYGAVNTSCALDRCVLKVREMIDWEHKYPARDMGNGKIRAVGMGMAMQGSGISGMDVGSATLKLNDDGFYSLIIGAADMGTGCDTTLAQIAAEVLDCPLDNIAVFGADTDPSPYDSGSYASSTTYVTGKATEKCAMKLREQICKLGAELLGCPADAVEFDGKEVFESAAPETKKTLSEIAYASQFGHMVPLEATETHTSPLSPPPFMVGAAEVEVDTETGEVKVLEFDACVDCGTPINPNLTRVQAEGGILQGIGMALTENVTYNDRGMPRESSLMQYKIPCRTDIGHIDVSFESSYEGTGPFGAKSIGEVVINTPLPAVADAIYHATHKRFYELPITREQIALAGQ